VLCHLKTGYHLAMRDAHGFVCMPDSRIAHLSLWGLAYKFIE
jgi:hypothetical protein